MSVPCIDLVDGYSRVIVALDILIPMVLSLTPGDWFIATALTKRGLAQRKILGALVSAMSANRIVVATNNVDNSSAGDTKLFCEKENRVDIVCAIVFDVLLTKLNLLFGGKPGEAVANLACATPVTSWGDVVGNEDVADCTKATSKALSESRHVVFASLVKCYDLLSRKLGFHSPSIT